MDTPGGVDAEREVKSTAGCIPQFALSCAQEESTNVGIGEENSSVESEQPLIGGDGVAGGGGEAHALLQPGAAAQPGDLPHAAVPPVVDAPNPSQIENMSEASQAQYLWFMKTFPKLEDGADS
uniref:Predicted protein n=1 Tax=Physcomitrium patens TaxID=3218 RepID=A9TDD7_PHYPA|nr:uncharacterized protein LOC112295773 [Physcomitrium patens]PNR33739.1 hypothetical protein PHYPA_023555 [Physcomitrium patens]|eukprot:XP_024403475.1 uncharacterized protein LOC112295773 [Physcomitrella patens]